MNKRRLPNENELPPKKQKGKQKFESKNLTYNFNKMLNNILVALYMVDYTPIRTIEVTNIEHDVGFL